MVAERTKELPDSMEMIWVQNELVQTEPTSSEDPVDSGGHRAEKEGDKEL